MKEVIHKRLRSVEIVLALMVSLPWMHPLENAADDDTSTYIAMAVSMAVDLSLHKIIHPTSSFSPGLLNSLPKADHIAARRALQMDGFHDVDPNSEWGQRLLRRRERVWIALFIQERGACFARGRPTIFPRTSLLAHCDEWHTSVVGKDPQDDSLLSMAVLRRDLDPLFDAIRTRCDNYLVTDVGSQVAKEIEDLIEKFFTDWFLKWAPAMPEGPDGHPMPRSLPPYVEILVTHTRLSTYASVINHPTAPSEVKKQFRASALSSALNVMRAAIQGEERLMSMPNNTVVMICFAACVALNLSTPTQRRSGTMGSSSNGSVGSFGYEHMPTIRPGNIHQHLNPPWDSGLGSTPSGEPHSGYYGNGHGTAHGVGNGSSSTIQDNGAVVTTQSPNQHNLVPSICALIDQAATVLIRIGSTPPHRNGTSVIYGKYMRDMLPKTRPDPETTNLYPPLPGPFPVHVGQFAQHTSQGLTQPITLPLPDPNILSSNSPGQLQFGEMSSFQIDETIMNADFMAGMDDDFMDGLNNMGLLDTLWEPHYPAFPLPVEPTFNPQLLNS